MTQLQTTPSGDPAPPWQEDGLPAWWKEREPDSLKSPTMQQVRELRSTPQGREAFNDLMRRQVEAAAARPKTPEEQEFEDVWLGFGNPARDRELEQLKAALDHFTMLYPQVRRLIYERASDDPDDELTGYLVAALEGR